MTPDASLGCQVGLPGLSGVALVTAAAGIGVGQAVARRLAAAGATVVVTDVHTRRTEEVTTAIAADFPATTVIGYPLDVGSFEAIDRVVDDVSAAVGPINILVNNAAYNVRAPIEELSTGDWQKMIDVNLSGPWYLCRRVMSMMRAHSGGVIVNISSYAGDIGVEGAYGVAKTALNALTRVCAVEGGSAGIRAVGISTGFIVDSKWGRDHPEMANKPFTRGVLGSAVSAGEVAEAVAFLASNHASHITGETLQITSGAYFKV